MVQRLACLVLRRYRELAGPTPVEETAQALNECAGLDRTYEHVMSTLIAMIDCGNFYKTLKTDVGGGACLVPGASLPETQYVVSLTGYCASTEETSWTKLMTKRTAKRTRVVKHLTASTQVPPLAARYAATQERIIDAKVDSLLFEQSSIDAQGLGSDAFEEGLGVSDELTTDSADFALGEMWGMTDL
ncbi:hypothetical protein KC330_g8983 [Hortaea werneckii]|nr:hypothetical protein KC330_g8983 [Hortaea werneckii]